MGLQEIFISNLRRIRREKKITQEKLAELCHTDTSYIGQIEIGKRFPSIQLIEKISEALEIPAYILFKDEKSNYNTAVYNTEALLQTAENISSYVKDELSKFTDKTTK